jgi:prepilin-type N-terminal cleavage/methylation domain-containing protein/prepilin-type processing-associated H-X9-DG protein
MRNVLVSVHRRTTPYSRGFTLVELLVVIAIIAALTSMFAPVLAQVQNKARGYVCASNLRQIGMATSFYLQDYDEQFAAPNVSSYGWIPDVHSAYIKQWRVWVCPSDSTAQVWDGIWNSPTFQVRTSYLWNAYIFQGDASNYRYSIHEASLSYPATLVVWAEAFANAGWVNDALPLSAPEPGRAYLHNAYGDNLNASKYDPTAGSCPARHENPLDTVHAEGGNYVFADGHTKWLKPAAFTNDWIEQNFGVPVDDRSDPMVTNGARMAPPMSCPVFCCPQNVGMPPSDGKHPWFRP